MINENVYPQKYMEASPKFLWLLTLCYVMVGVFSNWYDSRIVHLLSFDTDAGTLIFPLTFLLSDLITEVYGYKHARRAIQCGFIFNLLFILYGYLVTHMPSPNYPNNNALFDRLTTTNLFIIMASGISYLISEPFNSYVMAKLKVITNGKLMGLRFIASTCVSSGVDSFIFGTIAFYKVMDNSNLISLILSMWLIKVIIELLALPVSIRMAKKLKTKEHLDIYDKKTKFNLLNFDAEYTDNDNEFYQRNK